MDMTPNTQVVTRNAVDENFSPPAFRNSAALLRTAIPYIDEDRALAEANVAYAQSEGALLDQEISRLRQNLDKAERRRSFARKFEEMERGLLSPVRKLPLDVLQHIFLLANEGVVISNEIQAFPRIASQVCSYWRNAAHSCAPLWTDVTCLIMPPFEPKANNPMYAMLLEDCVKYSKSMPMTVRLGCGATPELLGTSGVQAIARCAHRWDKVLINDGDLAKTVLSSVPMGMTLEYLETFTLQNLSHALPIRAAPKLRHLTITGDGRNVIESLFYVAVQFAPCLVQLTLESVYYPSMTLEGIDWPRITHFEASKMEYQPDELTTLLQRMPNLISLTIHGETAAFASVVLPHLEELKTGECVEVDVNIFDSLTAPRLRKLEIDWGTNMLSLMEFAGRSGCKIEELKLVDSWIDEVWHDPAFANVKTFIWEDPFSVGEGLENLVYGSAASPTDLFPALEDLQVTLLNGSLLEDDAWSVTQLIDMLSSRLRSQLIDASESRSYLKALRIDIFSHDDEFVMPLTNFVDSELVRSSGVQLDISGSNLHLSTSK